MTGELQGYLTLAGGHFAQPDSRFGDGAVQWRIYEFKKWAKFLLTVSAHARWGGNHVFQIFPMVKKMFLVK